MARLADRLRAARLRRFVGRNSEIELFTSALASEYLPYFVLHVYGPGGVGKSTLLQRYIWECQKRQIESILIDARNVDPSPDAFIAALTDEMGLPEAVASIEMLQESGTRRVILVDTYELLTPLDGWLRNEFLPTMSEEVLVVLAGRHPPSAPWRIDPGWQSLMRVLPLRNLAPEESQAYLELRNIPDERREAVLDFTHGHPLALSLVADVFEQRQDRDFLPEEEPDVVKTLLEQFVHEVPSSIHRAALEACSLVRVTTEALLAEILAMEDVHELFRWLRSLSFIESRPGGLFPHDLVRESLARDVRWRNQSWYTELHRRARQHYLQLLQSTSGNAQQRAMMDYIYLHRDNPIVQPFFEWRTSGGAIPAPMGADDREAILTMIEEHEGHHSARLAAGWLEEQPEALVLFRDMEGQPAGFVMMLSLDSAPPDQRKQDPATRAAWGYLENRASLRSGERATLFRFWMARETYQKVSPIQSLIFINMVRHYLTTPALAFTFLPCADPDFWAPVFAYADLARLPEADFEVEGRRYGVYGHDWRAVPPMAWLELLAERETNTSMSQPPAPRAERLIVLSKQAFYDAAESALNHLHQPGMLRGNPLLRSRLVADVSPEASEAEREQALRDLLTEGIEQFKRTPKERKLFRVLYHSYLQPAPTQEAAAELLNLSLSTYRRHRKAAVEQLTTRLWQQEIGALDG